MSLRRLLPLVITAILVLGVQGRWTDGLGAAPAARTLKNRQGEEVGRIEAGGVVRHVLARGRPVTARTPQQQPDPDLEPGFPVQAFHSAGGYYRGPAIHTLIGEIDGDAQLEIIVTGLASGPIYAWNHNGTPLLGWPVAGSDEGYLAIWEDLPLRRGVVAGYVGFPGEIAAYQGDGSLLPGWPRLSANYVAAPPGAADVDGALPDEIFIEEEDWNFHGYRLNGTVLPGWPVYAPLGNQARNTPAFADLDGDGDLEILTVTGYSTGGVYLLAYHHTGTSVAGFPVGFNGYHNNFVAVGDVDADGQLEIVIVAPSGGTVRVLIYSATGALKRSIPVAGTRPAFSGTAAALADLNGDRVPEIIVLNDGYMDVVQGNGTHLPGWPVATGGCTGHSAPVVGDVDGDAQQEVVITSNVCGSYELGEVRVYNADGTLHPRFPKALNLGLGAVPAIADIDRDGRNEIIVCGDYWNGIEGFFDKCWPTILEGDRTAGSSGDSSAGTGTITAGIPFPA